MAQSQQKAADFLIRHSWMQTVQHRPQGRRTMVRLRATQVYASLVALYQPAFFAAGNTVFHGPNPGQYGVNTNNGKVALSTDYAKTYIAAFFHDLYVVNSITCESDCPEAFVSHFNRRRPHYLSKYDVFLKVLNDAIRPTIAHGEHSESMMVPFVVQNPDFDDGYHNYFNIGGYYFDEDILSHIRDAVFESPHWKYKLAEINYAPARGRVSWLFDFWPAPRVIMAWFPQENNYNDVDVVVAYIVGTALSPRLAPVDRDIWRDCPGNASLGNAPVPGRLNNVDHPSHYDISDFEERDFAGEVTNIPELVREKRDFIMRKRTYDAAVKAYEEDSKNPQPGSEPTYICSGVIIGNLKRYRVRTYRYKANVVNNISDQSRRAALKLFNS